MQSIPFDNSYISLPDRFYSRVAPQPVRAPAVIRVNHPLAQYLGLDPALLESEQGAQLVGGNSIPAGAEPIATAYAGHQFGHLNPQLGDGRAVLLGEVVAPDGKRHDLQLKGSGVTPWSRGGDGRSPLGPVLREYVISEAMAALGIPTTRSLAAVTTGEVVWRETGLPGGVLLRVARSHIRVGTFEYFAVRRDADALRHLVEHVIARHFPQSVDSPLPALSLLAEVAERQAQLVAQWQLVGFIHGVMNTDNMLVSGETIDYGPCAFMDSYDPATVYSSIDQHGRYAYENQPPIAQFNLACLARALLPLLNEGGQEVIAEAQAQIDGFPGKHETAYRAALQRKLGLSTQCEGDDGLATGFLQALQEGQADFTLGFRYLTDLAAEAAGESDTDRLLGDLFEPPAPLQVWIADWQERLALDPRDPAERAADMRAANPALIPRNHQVEAVIRAAEDRADFGPFHALVDVLSKPHHYARSLEPYARPPQPDEVVEATFCGT